ncbi:hypothetical protein KDI_53270 [Dictyobacter arantiisoli]|uniref:HTH cro/C1-type domain-containing protein n=2 Tax=Dictyobacter arantiisoli TaxID=2014874 RepID=A0A5A5TL29_9CHLR|nr:hypothetical protein KDI_53270 [Dictyobacter arantiisoli]
MKEITKVTPNMQLKLARERRGWSQKYVAQEVGTDAFTVSRWERGATLPSPHFRQQLSTLFDSDLSELGLFMPKQSEVPDQAQAQATVQPEEDGPATPKALFDPAIPPAPANEKSLVGRDEVLRQLKQQLFTGAGKPVSHLALNGLPGVGKTALATTLAYDEEVRAHFSDGILWAGLGYETDLMGQLNHWALVLNSTLPDPLRRNYPEAWAECIHATIGQRHMLLIIDDAWEFKHALALQVGGMHCTHLVTTRFPEIAQRFAPEKAVVVRELADSDARLLLMRLAPEAVQAEPEEVQALTAIVGGLPLALTLLGNYLRVQTYGGQPRRLRAALERLRHVDERLQLSEPQALIGAHPNLSTSTPLSLQAVIGMSDRQISERARTALRALAIFPPKPNTFSEEAAIRINALPVEALDELMDAGLLESSGPARYTLHQTIADYARTQLTDSQVTDRFVHYYVAYVETQVNDDGAISHEYNNILAALEIAFEQQMLPALLQGVRAFAPLLIIRGLYTVAATHLQRFLDAAQALEDVESQATAWLNFGKIAEQRADYASASAHWQQALLLAQQDQLDGLVAEILMELGTLARQQGQPEQAQQFFQQAHTIAHQLGDQYRIGATLRNLGILAREQGQPEQASQFTEEALAAFQQLGNQREIARTLNGLGILARHQGQPEQARQCYEKAVLLFRQVGDQRGVATSLGNLSRIVAIHEGNLQRAHQLYQEALDIFEHLGDRRSSAQVLHGIGSLQWEQGQPEQAERTLQESLRMLREIGDQHTIALTLGELGIHAREQEHLEQASQLLEEAYALFQELKDRRQEAIALRELGALARAQDDPARASQLLHEALTTLHELHDRREEAMAQYELGIVSRQQGKWDEARRLLNEALTTFHAVNDQRTSALAQRELEINEAQKTRLVDD